MYKKVLVPLDRSELAEGALTHVINLAKDGAIGEVILLNVAVVDVAWDEWVTEFNLDAIRSALMSVSEKYLADVRSRLNSAGVKARAEIVESSSPAHAISDYAQKNGVDLIVLATHGYTGIKKLMFGSVALAVLHDARMPVLLIRP